MNMKKNNKDMPLEINLRRVGNSLVLTVPSEILKLYGLKEGDSFELVPGVDHLTLRSKKNI